MCVLVLLGDPAPCTVSSRGPPWSRRYPPCEPPVKPREPSWTPVSTGHTGLDLLTTELPGAAASRRRVVSRARKPVCHNGLWGGDSRDKALGGVMVSSHHALVRPRLALRLPLLATRHTSRHTDSNRVVTAQKCRLRNAKRLQCKTNPFWLFNPSTCSIASVIGTARSKTDKQTVSLSQQIFAQATLRVVEKFMNMLLE